MYKWNGYCGWLLGCLLLTQSPGAGEEKQVASRFTLVKEESDGWEIIYSPRSRGRVPVTLDGKTHFRFADPPFLNQQEVENPSLPADALVLGIPFGATLSVELLTPEYNEEEDALLAPAPSYHYTEDHDAIEVFKKNPVAYAHNTFLPTQQIEIQEPFMLREQSVCVVRVHPYQYNAATSRLRQLVKATLRVRFQTRAHKPHMTSLQDSQFEETYKALLWNYQQAKQWRVRPARPAVLPPDPSRDWFETNKNYYKALIGADGWYKITRSDLQVAGANVNSIDLLTLKVFARGNQVPLVIRPDTTVEFYAYHNFGDSTYVDFFTDTSAYWLTWGGVAGLRFDTATVSGPPSSTLISSKHTVHFEKDSDYFQGVTGEEFININTVPGEGWYWGSLSANGTAKFAFELDSIDITAPTATLRVRLWGTSYVGPPSPPTIHSCRVWVNDSLAGDIVFTQRTSALLTATIPTSWLKAGSDTLRVKNLGTEANRVHLDWFEVDYQRVLRAKNDQLLFLSPNSSGGDPIEFRVRGFSNSQIEVYDLNTKKAISGTVSGDSATGFTVAFSDTFSSPRTYIALCSGSQKMIPPLKQKMFSDIRVNTQGADYVIVTHNNFLVQSNQLAAFRQSMNGVRVKVVDVEEIYDEFNYGVMNATVLKTFLQYAYANWSAPALAHVLFMGDASWDYRRNFASTIKTNFVPSYGVPTGDNWFGCFNQSVPYIPSIYIGRIPAEDPQQAQSVINKIIGHENYPVSSWNKNFLFITGGNTLSEQSGFNYLAESSIDTYVKPPPLGGTPLRVYKTTPGWIDGENKTVLKDHFRNGLSFVNFTGHSGGRVWGVDPGPPSELENTNGMLPFISSVSCNVGGFASPANSVLAEQFVIADNRGAIASWASSSLGYATYGAALTNYLLANACTDSVREFGKLTTNARYQLWFETGAGYVTIAMVNLNPLIGDPMSKLAVPLKPEFAISPVDISLSMPTPTPNDSALTLRLDIHNYGLVPTDSLGITLTDVYNGQTTSLLNNVRVRRTLHIDSLFVQWKKANEVGPHTLVTILDPNNTNPEVNELNNIAASEKVIYTNNLFVVKPLNNVVVPAGAQRLVVTSPIGYDSTGFSYHFELDTLSTFDSPARVVSGAIPPGAVSGEWVTPVLPAGQTYFWRARTLHGALAGNWVTSSFSISTELPSTSNALAPLVRWRENTKKQFAREIHVKTTATDSGVTIGPSAPLYLYARSVGYRYNQVRDYYSQLEVNNQKVIGFWWELGGSFMVARVNDFTGTFEFKSFAVSSNPALSDSMQAFINATPTGNYLSVAVIFNGQSSVNEGLKRAMDTLGATLFRSIVAGQSYAFIGRKGNGAPGMPPLEQLTDDTAVVKLTVPNFYSLGSGSMTTAQIPVPQSWSSFHWRPSGDFAKVSARVALLGFRTNGGIDTLRLLSKDSIDVDLSVLNTLTLGPRFSSLKLATLLSTSDANVTPVMKDWWLDFSPPPDLAVSARTVGTNLNDARNVYTLPVTVHNIGYAKSDSVRVVVNALDKYNRSQQLSVVSLDSVSIDDSRTMNVEFSTTGLPRRTKLQVIAFPARKQRDLITENNTAYYMLYLNTVVVRNDVQVFANGTEIMNGDYISSKPTILVRPVNPAENMITQLTMTIDNKSVETQGAILVSKAGLAQSTAELVFTPTIPEGRHELKFHVAHVNALGDVDSLERTVTVNVSDESKVLQVSNFPNPFRTSTHFTFVLTGAQLPDDLTIRIFTVAGRKIRELVVPSALLQFGFNRIPWDGRDDDGDEIANGNYFYQVQLKREGRTDSAIQKLAKIK